MYMLKTSRDSRSKLRLRSRHEKTHGVDSESTSTSLTHGVVGLDFFVGGAEPDDSSSLAVISKPVISVGVVGTGPSAHLFHLAALALALAKLRSSSSSH